MNPLSLLFSFTGRITRLSFWLGIIALAILQIIALVALNPAMLSGDPDTLANLSKPNWTNTLVGLAFLIPFTAIYVKRFNDRNRPYWIGFALVGIYAIYSLLPHFLGTPDPTAAELTPDMIIFMVFAVLMTIIGLWSLIDLGFLRGTKGPNQYGPDPKGDSA
ncbi:MAG: DUF805 domain-containing protein [Hyphomicrobiaceae bacterium]